MSDELDQELLDLLNEDEEVDEEDGKVDTSELKSLIEELKRENKGLLQAKQEEKRKRQEGEQRLSRIEDTLDKIISTKKTPTEEVDSITKRSRIPVEFTEKGEAFISNDKLNEVLTPHQQRIKELEEKLQSTAEESRAATEADKLIREIVGEDERFNAVYNDYRKARAWVNDKVVEFQIENGVEGKMRSGQALDLVFDSSLEDEFTKQFPGMNLESVVTAEDSARLFRKMLKEHLPKEKETGNQDVERFKKVLGKPSSLAGVKNSKSAELNVFDKLDALSTDDILGLTDAQVRALEKAMREEEMRG